MVENRSLTPQQQGRSFPDVPEGMKQELTSRNALKPPGRTGQREDLFTNHLELLLANLFFSSLLSELLYFCLYSSKA